MPVQEFSESLRQRLWDLVRYKRSDLFEDGLLTPEEYAELAEDHAAVARLESYDGMRLRLAQIKDLATSGLETTQDAVGTLKKVLALLP